MHNIIFSSHTISKFLKGWFYTMDMNKIVCYCNNVTIGMIKEAVDSGASTLEEVQEITNAGTVCGSCINDIQHLIEEFLKERDG